MHSTTMKISGQVCTLKYWKWPFINYMLQ